MKKLIVTVNGVSYEVEVELVEEDNSNEQIGSQINQGNFNQNVVSSAVVPSAPNPTSFARPTQPNTAGSDNILRSPMSGKVMQVKVAIGENVKQGQVVIELEAMKMKTNVFAPKDGVIKSIFVNSGILVESGQKMLEFE